jgi:hypothetical protein
MSPKQRLVTTVWCAITMIVTMILSHGHLIMREIMMHWPAADSWEGRFENALYTQGGLVFLASIVIGVALLVRGYFSKQIDETLARKELAQREQHQRAEAQRHDALMSALSSLSGGSETSHALTAASSSKKPQASGARPR